MSKKVKDDNLRENRLAQKRAKDFIEKWDKDPSTKKLFKLIEDMDRYISRREK